jgi:hypothetical protein
MLTYNLKHGEYSNVWKKSMARVYVINYFAAVVLVAELVDVKNHKKQKEVEQKFITVKEAWHDFVVSILTGFVA